MPPHVLVKDEKLNGIVLSLAFLLPILAGAANYGRDANFFNGNTQAMQAWLTPDFILLILNDLVKFMILATLGFAMGVIRKHLIEEDQEDAINTKSLIIHFIVFATYLLSLIGFLIL